MSIEVTPINMLMLALMLLAGLACLFFGIYGLIKTIKAKNAPIKVEKKLDPKVDEKEYLFVRKP